MLARNSRGLSRSAQMLRTHVRGIAVGDKFPNVEVRSGAHSPFCLLEHTPDNRAHVPPPPRQVDAASWPPTALNLNDRIKDKKVILVGLPGAFTPT